MCIYVKKMFKNNLYSVIKYNFIARDFLKPFHLYYIYKTISYETDNFITILFFEF